MLCRAPSLIRRIRTKRSKSNEPNTWTVFISRTGLVIVALTMGSAAYGAVVNAMGFFFLGKLLIPMHLVAKDKFNVFQELYLGSIGYNLAEMEFVNWLTTFSIGGFLVAGVGYQLFKISTSRDGSETPRGYYIQNVVSAFLWFSLAGFLIVFFSYLAGITGWLHLSNCSGKTCKIFSIELSPFEIYLVSATRILPFLLPIFLSSLRVGLNVAADILLYILPTKFPLSIQEKASSRLAVLLDYLRSKHPEKPISLLAHSQGTVIGRDVLEATPVDQFVTAGSPLSSLYDRFLGIPVAMPITGCHWVNMYRVSDYIAGPLHQKGVQDVEVKTNYRANHLHYFDDSAVVARALGKADAPEVIRPIVTESTSEPSSPTMSDLGCRLLISNVCVILLLVVAANAFFMAVVLGHDTASTVIWSSAGALAKMLVGEDPDRLLTFSLLSSICVFAGGVIGGICINDTRRRSWIWLASFVVCYLLVLQYITGVPLDEWWYTDCKPDGSDCSIHFSTYSSTPIRLVSWALGTPSALYLGAVCSNWLMRICDGNSSTSSS